MHEEDDINIICSHTDDDEQTSVMPWVYTYQKAHPRKEMKNCGNFSLFCGPSELWLTKKDKMEIFVVELLDCMKG